MQQIKYLIFTLLAIVLVFGVLSSAAEAKSKSYKLAVSFSDFCCGWHGKVQVKLHNHSTFKLIGQEVFDFKKLLKKQKDCCHGEMTFDGKSVNTGDQIKVRATSSQPSGGSYGFEGFIFDKNVHKYQFRISLEETGCDLPGFSCN